ncbi:SDR family NAD(P)-dependent oxidoreductase, partial [Candidatus Entotheonella palauensis]|uniref:SDR family NAD(P)-dependent oxidoreductase n=1 Tax=Candidatus Entotheonella palauensis TaxID=93172 RepID=UPI0011788336
AAMHRQNPRIFSWITVAEEMRQAGQRVTPVALEQAWAPLARSRDVYRTLTALQTLGATAQYLACDVRHSEAVAQAVKLCREQLGTPTVVLHGAGVERSHQIADKSEEEFDLVHDVKVSGWWNLQDATRDDPVKLVANFSSLVGCFGNAGQADYAAANKVLNAAAQQMAGALSKRHLTLAWTAWAETGMAARGAALERLEQAGITPLSIETGTAACVQAMTGDAQGALLVCGSVGGLDSWQSFRTPRVAPETCLIEKVVEHQPAQRLLAYRQLDRSQDLFLNDHAINGSPYMPGCMGLEGFAQGAQQLHPGLTCTGFEDVTFTLPVKLTGPTFDLELVAETSESSEITRVACRWERQLRGSDGTVTGPRLTHFEGTCLMQPERRALGSGNPIPHGDIIIPPVEIYRRYFHGPSFQVYGGVLRHTETTIEGVVDWNELPLLADVEPRFAIAPLVLEAALQNAGLLAMIRDAVQALPVGIRRMHVGPLPPQGTALFTHASLVHTDSDTWHFDAQIMDQAGHLVMVLDGLQFKVSGPLDNVFQLSH